VGAGDTVVAAIAAVLGGGGDTEIAAQLAIWLHPSLYARY